MVLNEAIQFLIVTIGISFKIVLDYDIIGNNELLKQTKGVSK